MIRVGIIDDHAVVRMGLKHIISLDDELEFAGEADNAVNMNAVRFVREAKPDVLLLDILMPGKDGLQALEELLSVEPEQKVIMLTTSTADNDAYRAFCFGARGYLLKDRDANDIYKAIKTVAAGGKFFPEAVKKLIMERKLTDDLTPREQCVLNMMVEGCANEKIAEEMGMSMSGVKQHVRHIFTKLGVTDRVNAVTSAIKRGFVRQ